MKIVLDTNVLISALIKEGKPRQLLFRIVKSKHQLIISEQILEELALIANEPKIQRYVGQQDVADFLRDIATASKIMEIRSKFEVVEEDPSDDIVLRTAYDARAATSFQATDTCWNWAGSEG
jgi:uncharacterized protein